MTAPAIRVEAVSKYFPKSGRIGFADLLRGLAPEDRFTALDNVSLAVPEGEVVGILGRNGAGKSTLLRLVGGIYSADAGVVTLTGDVASLFELGGFGNTQLTGREFAQRYLQLFGVPRPDWPAVLQDVHEFSELGDYFNEPIRTFSAGMAARLYFSVATAIPHEIYLIDEILSVGDEHFQTKSWARMRERLAGGASGLLVTHDWAAVIKLCRQSKVLEAGRIVLDGPSDAVVAGYLDLPRPVADRARLAEPPAAALQARSGEDYTLTFEVEIMQPGEVEASVSIEALQLGVGWEPVILTEFAPVGRQPGRHAVSIGIASLPLAPGQYTLNLFLAGAPEPGSARRRELDARGWTYGNGLVLTVHGGAGQAGGGVAPFPLRWTEEAP